MAREEHKQTYGVESAVGRQEPARDGHCQRASTLGVSSGSLVVQMIKNLSVIQETLV